MILSGLTADETFQIFTIKNNNKKKIFILFFLSFSNDSEYERSISFITLYTVVSQYVRKQLKLLFYSFGTIQVHGLRNYFQVFLF